MQETISGRAKYLYLFCKDIYSKIIDTLLCCLLSLHIAVRNVKYIYLLTNHFFFFQNRFLVISKNGPKWTHFVKIACKIARSKYFLKNLHKIGISRGFPLK